MNSTVRLAVGGCCLALLIGLAGCSGGQATAKVSGKVTHNGQPVTGGMLTFSPVASSSGAVTAGKGATGEIKSDGTYVLTTNIAGDGAVIGRHKVTFLPRAAAAAEAPAAEPGKHDEAPAASPFKGLMPKEPEVEVKAGENAINIELVPDPKAALILNPPQ
jgi:hypothetical protein